jgi:hypothetical protein
MDDSAPLNPCVEKTIALVFETFRGVTREGGVSWSESEMHDRGASEKECLEARQADKEVGWEELANDTEWEPFPGTGGFIFLDAIGFRYYLPAAMVKCLRAEYWGSGILEFHLDLPMMWQRNYTLKQWSKLQTAEIQCVCVFLKCMIAIENEQSMAPDCTPWGEFWSSWDHAYRSYWVNLDANPLPE